ncbi:hypothetical protein BP6252_06361 [Coleophoma cylindrospora]|uniref:Transmembrane protein n=1 Tax=Coleophoma cylindrospora TaxID=1849047 RepID=A0A3D8RME2_9HELO|nr:hypothetical protein BP6252_06361 [Coleophoma cylindrospora]
MRAILLLSLMLNLFYLHKITAQGITTSQSTAAATSVSLTPAMSSSSVASFFSALATTTPQQPGGGAAPGDTTESGNGVNSDAGASGASSGGIQLSRAGIVAVIVVIVVVVVFGIASSILFWQAKKRSWEVRKKIRRSAKRVATALTPRRMTFPKDVRNSRGLQRIDEAPPTPRSVSTDIEKGSGRKMKSFEMLEPQKKPGWAKKFRR